LKGDAYLQKRDFKKARNTYSYAEKIRPDDPIAYFQLAKLDVHDLLYDDAISRLDRVLSLKAEHMPALSTKVSIYRAQKQPARAIGFLDEQILKHKDNPMLTAALYEMQGETFASQRDYEKSEIAFKKALELNPNMAGTYLSLAKIYTSRGKTGEAIIQFQKLIEKQPKLVQAHLALGAIYEAEGKEKEAQRTYEKALEISPDFAPAANNLAWLLLLQDQDPDRALKLAKIAKAQLPDDPNIADTLGLALIATGQYPEAISELRNATEKAPQNPTILYHLGLAYWKNGEKDKARDVLTEAMTLKKLFPEQQAAKKLLEEIIN